jgi:hypothetical protein
MRSEARAHQLLLTQQILASISMVWSRWQWARTWQTRGQTAGGRECQKASQCEAHTQTHTHTHTYSMYQDTSAHTAHNGHADIAHGRAITDAQLKQAHTSLCYPGQAVICDDVAFPADGVKTQMCACACACVCVCVCVCSDTRNQSRTHLTRHPGGLTTRREERGQATARR